MKNLVLTLFTALLCYGNVWTQCPSPASNIIFFQTQQEINDFASSYPNCTMLNGSLTIGGVPQNNINDLTPLSQLESIEGRLSIINSSLTTLAGLDNLESIGDFLSITNNDNLTDLTGLGSLSVMGGNFLVTGNDALNTLTGLESLNSVSDLYISSNSSLTALSGLDELVSLNGDLVLLSNGSLNDLTALSSVAALGGGLQISNEPVLTNLAGLQNLSNIGGSFFIGSTGLTSLSALENLTIIEGDLRVSDNDNLTELTGLGNINYGTIANLNITDNSNLSVCGVKSVCNYLAAGLSATIQDNAIGCTDENEVCVEPLINSECDTIVSEDFEEGWGIWIDGGSDAARVSKSYYATSGTYSINIQDNSSTSVITSQNLDLAQYPFISVDFSFYAVSMDFNESFLVEISTDGGQNFDVIKEFTVGEDFENGTYNTVSVPTVRSLTSQTQIRFRCNASSNTDDVYLDDIVITACTRACNEGQFCDDGDPCTVGETYDANCNCTGGIFQDQDEDGDGVCDNNDICPNFNNDLIGTPCDDGNICTTNDLYDGNCDCQGTYVGDRDGDGICDTEDPCPDQSGNTCIEYCEAQGVSTTYEYIQSVTINGFTNETGRDGGYGDYTHLSGIMVGDNVPITLTAGFTEYAYNENWVVWIDLNKDGDFDDSGEEVFSGTSHGTQPLTGVIHVPASFGLTRMRVVMRWKQDPNPCGQFQYGEVEDYIVDLGSLPQGKTTTENTLIQTYPNPASSYVNVDIHDIIFNSNVQSVTAMIYTMNGQQVHSEEMQPTTTLTINTQHLPEASYILHLHTDDGRTFTGKFVKL